MGKALFLAMSGVRIKNERLLSLGMTLPGFVERGEVIASLPSLGLLTIAGCLPAHWEAEYREVEDTVGPARASSSTSWAASETSLHRPAMA